MTTDSSFINNWRVTCPTAQTEIATMVANGMHGKTGPENAIDRVGGYKGRAVLVMHAVDRVVFDDNMVVKLITRLDGEASGKWATVGGMRDANPNGVGIEDAALAADREDREETGAAVNVPSVAVGPWRVFRPFGIRVWWADNHQLGIAKGDIVAVTTQVCVAQESHGINNHQAMPTGRIVKLAEMEELGLIPNGQHVVSDEIDNIGFIRYGDLERLERNFPGSILGVPDHMDMVRDAAHALQRQPTPSQFTER